MKSILFQYTQHIRDGYDDDDGKNITKVRYYSSWVFSFDLTSDQDERIITKKNCFYNKNFPDISTHSFGIENVYRFLSFIIFYLIFFSYKNYVYWWSEFERTLQSCLYIDGTELILKLTVIVEIIFGIVMWFVVNGSDELNLALILILWWSIVQLHLFDGFLSLWKKNVLTSRQKCFFLLFNLFSLLIWV